MLSRYRLQRINDEERLHRLGESDMGRVGGNLQEEMTASEWAVDSVKEAVELLAQDETAKMSIVQDIMLRRTDYLRRVIARWRTRRSHDVIFVPQLQQFPSGRQRLVGIWEKHHKVVVRNLWRKVRLEATEQASGRANWGKFEQAKVFKALALPHCLCANMVNALKLLGNQQEDGDGFRQNIVTNLGKGSRRGLTDGLREFIEVDNERSLDVGALRRGKGTLKFGSRKLRKGARM